MKGVTLLNATSPNNIQSHANTTVFEVSQVTGVSLKVIMQFVREDRVQIVDTKNKINLKE